MVGLLHQVESFSRDGYRPAELVVVKTAGARRGGGYRRGVDNGSLRLLPYRPHSQIVMCGRDHGVSRNSEYNPRLSSFLQDLSPVLHKLSVDDSHDSPRLVLEFLQKGRFVWRGVVLQVTRICLPDRHNAL